jgi:hypothetical protein
LIGAVCATFFDRVAASHDKLALPGEATRAGSWHGHRGDPTLPIRSAGAGLRTGGIERHKARPIGGLRFGDVGSDRDEVALETFQKVANECHSSVTLVTRLASDPIPSGHGPVLPEKRRS